MRDVLFRGKEIDTGKWVFGDLIENAIDHKNPAIGFVKNFPPRNFESDKYDEYVFVEVYPETIGQFTGLTDKNKVKIFEGDKINYIFDGVIFHNTGDFVCFQNGYFGISRPNKNTKYIPVICDAKNIEVIGNILMMG